MAASSESLFEQRGVMGDAHCYNCVVYDDLERVWFERVLLLQSHEEALSSRWSYGGRRRCVAHCLTHLHNILVVQCRQLYLQQHTNSISWAHSSITANSAVTLHSIFSTLYHLDTPAAMRL